MKTGENVTFCENLVIRDDVILGNNVTIKAAVHLANGLRVGDDTTLGPAVVTLDKDPSGGAKGVTIGKRCFIGAGSIFLPGVTIGNDVIIGAGSVVTKDCLEPGLYIGSPCRKAKGKP